MKWNTNQQLQGYTKQMKIDYIEEAQWVNIYNKAANKTFMSYR